MAGPPSQQPDLDLTIRDATAADLPRLVALLAQLSIGTQRERPGDPLPATYVAAFEEVENDARQRVLVVEADAEIVASAVLVIVPNLSHQGRPYALIENIVVDEARRGGGVGEALVCYAIDAARAAGCYKLSLTSNKQRPDAHRFYERLGFKAKHEGFRVEL